MLHCMSCDTSRGWYLCLIVCPVTPVQVGSYNYCLHCMQAAPLVPRHHYFSGRRTGVEPRCQHNYEVIHFTSLKRYKVIHFTSLRRYKLIHLTSLRRYKVIHFTSLRRYKDIHFTTLRRYKLIHLTSLRRYKVIHFTLLRKCKDMHTLDLVEKIHMHTKIQGYLFVSNL